MRCRADPSTWRRRGRSDVDWASAKAFFVALPEPQRTFSRVAREFDVSANAVSSHARKEGWAELAEAADATVARRLLKRAVRTKEQRGEVVLRIADEAYDQIQELLLERKLEIKLSDFPAIDRVVRLETGEATEHVSFDEMQAGLRIAIGLAATVADELAAELLDGKATKFAKAYRERYVTAVNAELGSGE